MAEQEMTKKVFNPKPVGLEPYVRFAESPGQFLNRTYNFWPKRNHSQQAFTMFFGTMCAGFVSTIMWMHCDPLRRLFKQRASLWFIPAVSLPTLFADKWVSTYSRRGYQEMHRYDIDWRNMPTGV
jgi:hypothetical protein